MTTSPTWPAVGLYPNISPSVYFADQPGPYADRIVSKSLLWKFAQNPKRWRDSPPMVVTAAMKRGSLVDCLALTPDRVEVSYKIAPDTYVSAPAEGVILTDEFLGEWNGLTKLCKEWKKAQEGRGLTVMTPKDYAKESQPKPWNWNSNTCDEWLKSVPPGVEVVSGAEWRDAVAARDALQAHPQFQEMMEGGQTQLGMRVDYGKGVHGLDLVIPSKSLIDIVPARRGPFGNALADLKQFIRLDSLAQVEKEIAGRGYHMQAAQYLDAYNFLTGENRAEWYFVFQLSVAPYEVGIVQLDPEAIVEGRAAYLSAVKQWGKMVMTGKFTSLWDTIQTATLPKWHKKAEDVPADDEPAETEAFEWSE